MIDGKLRPQLSWPEKRREMHSHHFDSTVWNDFSFRDDDVVIATYAKSGTTWTQQIVAQLIFAGAEGINVPELSPWLDLRVPLKEVKLQALEAQKHRRFVKTHLPIDALVFSPSAKYLYVARDGRDVVWSMFNHHANANAAWYQALNETPGLVGPRIEPPSASVRDYFNEWLDRDGYPFWSFWDNLRSWWEVRHLPSVLLVHFTDMKADMEREIRRIADFLEIEVPADRWPAIIEHCSFDYMKAHASEAAPLGGAFWEGGAETFINKGTNGRWRDFLSEIEIARYDARAREKLGAECAAWLAEGGSAFRQGPLSLVERPR